jgi:Skp family chaperone for outer membrane proteins
MKRFTLVVLLLLFGALAVQAQNPPAAGPLRRQRAKPQSPPAASAASQTTPPKPGTKVGVIDFNSALFDSDPGKAAVKEIEKGLKPRKQNSRRFRRISTTCKPNAKRENRCGKRADHRDMDARTTEGKRLQKMVNGCRTILQQRFLPPVADLIKKMVDEYAKENDLAIVPRSHYRRHQHRVCRKSVRYHD